MELELDYEDEITEEDLRKIEKEIMEFAGPFPLPPPPPSERRMETILEKAKLEALARESADFMVDGVGPAAKGVLDALLSLGKKDDEDPKRSY